MPLYDYDCAECGRRVEVVHGVYAPGPTHCPNCGGGPLRKAISAPAVHFKGSGWAKKERRATVAPGVSGSGDTSSTNDGETKGGGDGEAQGGGDGEAKGADTSVADNQAKDRAASSGAEAKDKRSDRNRGEERPVVATKPAATGAATRTD